MSNDISVEDKIFINDLIINSPYILSKSCILKKCNKYEIIKPKEEVKRLERISKYLDKLFLKKEVKS